MDPDVILRDLRGAVMQFEDSCCEEHVKEASEELAEKFRALDEWLSEGGFLPSYWAR